jgi:DedD protein
VANSHEPSYYEIALTNRQVVVAFVILLICVLCAFFSGVYIGREGTLRDQDQLVRASPPPQTPANDEGRELEEFEFFDSSGPRPASPDQQAQAEPAPPPSRASADTTLLEDFSGEEDVEAVPEEDVEEQPAPEPEPTGRAQRRRERREQEERAAVEAARKAASTRPAREEKPAPARPSRISDAAATPASSSRAGKVVIQVFSSADKSQAERIRQRLVNGGHPAFLSPVEVGGSTMYRVRIGPYATRTDAQKVADQVRKGQKLDTWITE